MSKRRISHQQTRRIQQKQLRLQAEPENATSARKENGLVITRFGAKALIEDEKGNPVRCAIRPEITSLVAGDEVLWLRESPTQGVVVCVKPRKTELCRTNQSGEQKTVAANLSQLMITIAPIPRVSWSLLDSYLIIAEILHLKACIVLNKTDLSNEDEKQILTEIYHPLGYPILYTQRETITENAALLNALHDETSVFVGQSGVGKSSIISKLLADNPAVAIGNLSTSQQGTHTTSNSQLFHLACKGNLIDSPGVREFRLNDIPKRNIAQGFREFHAFTQHCQFRNCSHENTPNCAVIKAFGDGLISEMRYKSYCSLIHSEP